MSDEQLTIEQRADLDARVEHLGQCLGVVYANGIQGKVRETITGLLKSEIERIRAITGPKTIECSIAFRP